MKALNKNRMYEELVMWYPFQADTSERNVLYFWEYQSEDLSIAVDFDNKGIYIYVLDKLISPDMELMVVHPEDFSSTGEAILYVYDHMAYFYWRIELENWEPISLLTD